MAASSQPNFPFCTKAEQDMQNRLLFIAISLLLFSTAGAQQETDLLHPVDPAKARRLEEYNGSSLKEEVYFARRYRLVVADVDLLLQQRTVTVTPFDDVAPIRIEPLPGTPTRSGNDVIQWRGQFLDDPARGVPGLEVFGASPPVTILAHAFDLDGSGDATASFLNRFEFSPRWTFDEAGNPVAEPAPNGGSAAAIMGPPPQTPEQIERHKRLKNLKKEAFFSVRATFDLPIGSRYILAPLKYTPKYSVIYEITPDTVIPIRTDVMPGDPEFSATERAAASRYSAFRKSLPKDDGKRIREDIP
jgi:hypothetical protein